jgi:hypothetical protein
MSIPPVRREIVVEASQARAFRVFTEDLSAWWPLATHHIGAQPAESAILEPRAGGRWFERAADGSECPWGKVLVWDPPGRLVLAWQIDAGWKFDEDLMTEVEVRFVAMGPAQTRVELEHRQLENYGETAQQMQGIFDSDGGWRGILQRFASHALRQK